MMREGRLLRKVGSLESLVWRNTAEDESGVLSRYSGVNTIGVLVLTPD